MGDTKDPPQWHAEMWAEMRETLEANASNPDDVFGEAMTRRMLTIIAKHADKHVAAMCDDYARGIAVKADQRITGLEAQRDGLLAAARHDRVQQLHAARPARCGFRS